MAPLQSNRAYRAPLFAPTRSCSDSDSDYDHTEANASAATKRPSYADALRKDLHTGGTRTRANGWLQLSKEDVRNLPSAPNGAPLVAGGQKGWWEWIFGGWWT